MATGVNAVTVYSYDPASKTAKVNDYVIQKCFQENGQVGAIENYILINFFIWVLFYAI